MANSLGDLVVNVGAKIDGFSSAMTEVATGLEALAAHGEHSLERFDSAFELAGETMMEVVAIVGITTAAFETMEKGLEAFSKQQDVTSSFELLTGSADKATAAYDGLKEAAQRLAVPFEELIGVSQRLAPQFGVGTEALNAVLTASADAAAATGRSFGTIADGLDRIALTGQVSTRQMVQFGVSMQEIDTQMGVSVSEAIELLKKGGQDAQADVDAVVGAIEAKFGGAAGIIGENLSGQFTKLKNEVAFLYEEIGAAVAPIAEQLLGSFKDLEPTLLGIATGATAAFAGFKDIGGAIAGLMPDFLKIIASGPSMVALGTAIGFIGAALTAVLQTAHAAVLQLTDLVTLDFKKFKQDFADAGPAMQKAWVTAFQDVAAKGDALQAKLAEVGTEAHKLGENDGPAKAAAAIYGLSDAFKDLGVKVPPTQAEIDKVTKAFELVQQQYDAGQISLEVYNRSVEAFTKQLGSMYGKAAEAKGPLDQLAAALKALGIKEYTDDANKAAEATAIVAAGFASGRVSIEDYAAAIEKMDAAALKANPDLAQVLSSMDKQLEYNDAIVGMGERWDAAAAAVNGFAASASNLYLKDKTLDGALNNLGVVTLTKLGAQFKQAKADFDTVQTAFNAGVATSGELDAAWQRLLATEMALSQERLDERALGIPDLQALEHELGIAQQAYNDLASRGILNTTTALEGQIAKQRLAIEVAQQQGKDTTNLRIDLDAMQEALKRQTVGFADLAASLKQVELGGLQTAFHDLLFNIGGVEDAFKKMGESIVDTVVNRIIKDAMSPLLDSLNKVIDKGVAALEKVAGIGVNSIGSGGGVLGTSVGAAAADIGAAGSGAVGDIVSTGDTLAGVGQAAGSGSSVVGGLLAAANPVTAIVGAVAGVVGAISRIVGNFQMAGMNNILDLIEGNTLFSQIHLLHNLEDGV